MYCIPVNTGMDSTPYSCEYKYGFHVCLWQLLVQADQASEPVALRQTIFLEYGLGSNTHGAENPFLQKVPFQINLRIPNQFEN